MCFLGHGNRCRGGGDGVLPAMGMGIAVVLVVVVIDGNAFRIYFCEIRKRDGV